MNNYFDYELVYNYITSLIKNDLEENEKIPSENLLCEKFKLSRSTVRQGISKLKNEGIIYSVKGSGNYVSPKKIKYKISPYTTFSNEILKANKKPTLKLIKIKTVKANNKIASILELPQGSNILYMKNLRLVDEMPFLYAEYYINKSLLPNFEDEVKDVKSISKLYTSFYNLNPIRESSEIEIINSNEEAKRNFSIQHDLPIIKISTKTTDKKSNKIIDYCYSYFRSDMAKIYVDYKDGN